MKKNFFNYIYWVTLANKKNEAPVAFPQKNMRLIYQRLVKGN